MIGKARNTDPKTSHDAAQSMDTNKLERIVLDAIKAHGNNGATHDEVYDYLRTSKGNAIFREGSITPRYKQLEVKGHIYTNGTTRKGKAGRGQTVRYVKPVGFTAEHNDMNVSIELSAKLRQQEEQDYQDGVANLHEDQAMERHAQFLKNIK
jgi:hypothetical protein